MSPPDTDDPFPDDFLPGCVPGADPLPKVKMKAETQAVADEIRQSIGLLRRHL